MFKSINISCWTPFDLNKISLILGLVYGLRFICLFKYIKSLIKCTLFVLGLGCTKYGSPHSESNELSRTPSITKRYILFNLSLCNFVTGYGIKHIDFKFSFNFKSTGYVIQLPSVSSKHSSKFYRNLSNSSCCYFFKCWN